MGHSLSMAVQQYDLVVNDMTDWVPVDENGEIIDQPQDRILLTKALKQLRNKGNKIPENFKAPVYWTKSLH
jgi:hypothetical protein